MCVPLSHRCSHVSPQVDGGNKRAQLVSICGHVEASFLCKCWCFLSHVDEAFGCFVFCADSCTAVSRNIYATHWRRSFVDVQSKSLRHSGRWFCENIIVILRMGQFGKWMTENASRDPRCYRMHRSEHRRLVDSSSAGYVFIPPSIYLLHAGEVTKPIDSRPTRLAITHDSDSCDKEG